MDYLEYTVRVYKSGIQEWFKNGKLHREDGPAVVYSDGTEKWFKEGKLHREDGPAVVYPGGTKLWYKYDKIHREDGPAIIYSDGNTSFYLNGNMYTQEEFEKKTKVVKELSVKDVEELLGYPVKIVKG